MLLISIMLLYHRKFQAWSLTCKNGNIVVAMFIAPWKMPTRLAEKYIVNRVYMTEFSGWIRKRVYFPMAKKSPDLRNC